MSEEANNINLAMPEETISLTLEPTGVPAAAAVQEAPVMTAEEEKPKATAEEAEAAYMANVKLTPEEQKVGDEFSETIDITDSNNVL